MGGTEYASLGLEATAQMTLQPTSEQYASSKLLAIGSGPGDRQEAMHGGVATGHRSATIELGHMVGEWGWRSTKEWQAAIVEHTDAGWGRVGMSAHFEYAEQRSQPSRCAQPGRHFAP
eukprot:scaffold88473_cov33-Tisochrysis_lutea.AAC.1